MQQHQEFKYDRKHPTSQIIHELGDYLIASGRLKKCKSEEDLRNDNVLKSKLEFVMNMAYLAFVNIDQQGKGNKDSMLHAIDFLIQETFKLGGNGYLIIALNKIRDIVVNSMQENKEANFFSTPESLYQFNIMHDAFSICTYREVFISKERQYDRLESMKILLTTPHPQKQIEKILKKERTLASQGFFANADSTNTKDPRYFRGTLANAIEPYFVVKDCFFSAGAEESAEDLSDLVMKYFGCSPSSRS